MARGPARFEVCRHAAFCDCISEMGWVLVDRLHRRVVNHMRRRGDAVVVKRLADAAARLGYEIKPAAVHPVFLEVA